MLKWFVLVALLAVAVYVYVSGLHAELNEDSLRRLMTESGLWGPFIFIGLYVFGELVNIPSVLWVVVAGLTWPPLQAFLISWIASVLAAVVVFSFYRYIARDAVQARLPDRMKDLDERLQRGGLWAVTTIRLLAFLAPWTHPALAVSSVSLRDYTLGTALGVIPGVAVLVLFGRGIASGLAQVPLWVWVLAAAVVAVAVIWWRQVQKRRAEQVGPQGDD